MVYCPMRHEGCQKVMRFESVEHHIRCDCLFIQKKCAYENYGCDFAGIEQNFSDHLKECSYHKLRSFIKSTDQRIIYLESLVMKQQQMISTILNRNEDLITSPSNNLELSSPSRSEVGSSGVSQDFRVAQHNWLENGMSCVKTITTERSGVTSLAYQSGTLFAGAYDGSIKVFDSYSRSLKKTLLGHRLSVWSMAIDENLNRLYSGSSDESINVWSISSDIEQEVSSDIEQEEQPLISFGLNHGKVYSLISKEERVFSASSAGTINIWNSKSLDHIATLYGHSGGVNSIKFFGEYLYSASSDKTIKIWDPVTLSCIHTISQNSSEILDLTIGPNILFASSYDSNIGAFNLNNYSQISTMTGHKWEVWQVEYSNNVLFSGSHDHCLKIWDIRSFSASSTLEGHKGYIHALIWAEGGLLSASLDRQIKFWQ